MIRSCVGLLGAVFAFLKVSGESGLSITMLIRLLAVQFDFVCVWSAVGCPESHKVVLLNMTTSSGNRSIPHNGDKSASNMEFNHPPTPLQG